VDAGRLVFLSVVTNLGFLAVFKSRLCVSNSLACEKNLAGWCRLADPHHPALGISFHTFQGSLHARRLPKQEVPVAHF